MKKVLIEISHSSLTFSYCSPKASDSDFSSITENGINRIITTEDYIHKKYELFITFFNQTHEKNDISSLTLSEYDLFDLAFKLTNEIFKFETVTFEELGNLPKDIFDLIMNNEFRVTNLKCYSMPKDMFDSLKEKNINVEIESTLFFNSRLMAHNNFQTYEDLTNKEILEFDFEPDDYDYDDFNSFLKVNQKLHTIDIKTYYPNMVEKIAEILKENKKDDIAINVYEHKGDVFKDGKTVQKLAKKYRKNFYITIVYSDELRKSLIKQRIFIVSGILIPLILIGLIIYMLT